MNQVLLRNMSQVTRDSGEHSISGIVAAAMVIGNLVVRKATTSAGDVEAQTIRGIAPEYELVAADLTGGATVYRRPYFLERQVMTAQDYATWRDRKRRLLPDEVAHEVGEIAPVQLGTPVAARAWTEVQCEGSDYLHASVTGRLAGGTELTIVAGKFALRSAFAGSGIGARISGNIAPLVAANNFRYIIEIEL